MSLQDVLTMEYRLSQACMVRAPSASFQPGGAGLSEAVLHRLCHGLTVRRFLCSVSSLCICQAVTFFFSSSMSSYAPQCRQY